MPYKDPEKQREASRKAQRKYRENNPEKVKQSQRQYRKNNPEKEKKKNRKFREKNPDYMREWAKNNPEKTRENQRKYQKNNRKFIKNKTKELRDRAQKIYGNKCQFQAQTITIEGVEHHFKACAESWHGEYLPDILCFHHTKGDGRKENSRQVHTKIVKNGIQDDIELLCLIHHKFADIRDGTRYPHRNKENIKNKNIKKLFRKKERTVVISPREEVILILN